MVGGEIRDHGVHWQRAAGCSRLPASRSIQGAKAQATAGIAATTNRATNHAIFGNPAAPAPQRRRRLRAMRRARSPVICKGVGIKRRHENRSAGGVHADHINKGESNGRSRGHQARFKGRQIHAAPRSSAGQPTTSSTAVKCTRRAAPIVIAGIACATPRASACRWPWRTTGHGKTQSVSIIRETVMRQPSQRRERGEGLRNKIANHLFLATISR